VEAPWGSELSLVRVEAGLEEIGQGGTASYISGFAV
jgi:hypothetical protein